MKRYNKFVLITLLAVSAFIMSSCLKDEEGEKRDQEKANIATYVKNQNITVTPTASGLYYISDLEGSGLTPTDTDFALIKYTSTDLSGIFDDGTDKAQADFNQVTPYFILGGPLKIYMQGFMTGVIEGLKNMKEGGRATMIMPSSLSYNDYVPRIIKVELVKVIKDPAAYEREQIVNYLDTAFHKSYADSTATGIYYNEKLAGTGATPENGKYVTIKFKGYLPDGRVFDQTEGTETMKFRIGYSEAIIGLENGVKMMKVGGKSSLVIPYMHGYGFLASGYQDQLGRLHVIVPYFSTLVFDIELVSVTDN